LQRLIAALEYVRNGQRHLFWDVLSGCRRSAPPRGTYRETPLVVVRPAPSWAGSGHAPHERVQHGIRTLRVRLHALEVALDSQLASCFPEEAPGETGLLETGTS
jgi:hypothetical protein